MIGKYLLSLTKSDLRGLGFELFEYQKILCKSIKKLGAKYPRPNDSDSDSDDELEGVLQDTANGGPAYDKIDEKYKCPLSGKVMVNPVIASNGKIYDKDSIVSYIKINQKLPGDQNIIADIEQEIGYFFEYDTLKQEIQQKRQNV